jgi:hypothetical protein
MQFLRDAGIGLECLDTANAAATFNILTQEGRKVACALLPAPALGGGRPAAPPEAPPRSTTGPFPNWRDRAAALK